MQSLLNGFVTIKRNVITTDPASRNPKQPLQKAEVQYEHIPSRIIDKKLYIMTFQNDGSEIKIQRGDIVIDEITDFKYTIPEPPQYGGGMKHHWEASLEYWVNK